MEDIDNEIEDEIRDKEWKNINKFHISIEEEKKYWREYLLKYFIYKPDEYPQCKKK